jgi:hypothetical protein
VLDLDFIGYDPVNLALRSPKMNLYSQRALSCSKRPFVFTKVDYGKTYLLYNE